jgi:PAS domain S-box-containing protein
MHTIGIEALGLPVHFGYDWGWMTVALGAATAASWATLFVASRASMSLLRTGMGSLAVGVSLASMHYIGMSAMRLPAMYLYSPMAVLFFVLFAVALSFVLLHLAFTLRERNMWTRRRTCSAALIGLAIWSMHSFGISSVTSVPATISGTSQSHPAGLSTLGLTSIVLSTLLLLSIALIASNIDRKTSHQSRVLARTRRELEMVFDAMTEAVLVLDSNGTAIQMNRAAQQMFDLPPPPLTLENRLKVFDLLAPDGSALPRTYFPSALGSHGVPRQNYEIAFRRKDTGRIIFTEANIVPIPNPHGAPHNVLCTYRDIGERKQLDAARNLVAAIVQSSGDAIIGKDLNGVVTSWNLGAQKIFGYAAAEMIGKSIKLLLPPDREAEEDAILAQIRRGEVVDHTETARVRKDKQLIDVSLKISPIRDGWGKIVGASKVARDITAIKHMERQLRQSQKMDAIGQLTGGIAHDFNNLLGVIMGNLDLALLLVSDNPPAMKRLETAMKAANRGANLTRRLLAFSSTDELRPALTHLAHSARNMLELAGSLIGPQIRVIVELSSNMPAVLVDPAGLESSLLNLVVNARDAMPQGGALTIKTQLCDLAETYAPVKAGDLKAGCYACVSVSDTGCGMSKEVMDRAFEPFFTTKQREKGTGLGLAMVYGFARQSGGAVHLHSELGQGTTMSIFLPLSANERIPAAAHTIGRVIRMGGVALAVDDEPDLLDISVTYLSGLGYTVLQACNGTNALALLENRSDITLMITDIIMPGGMNGVELAGKARTINSKIKVVYSSGFPAGILADKTVPPVDGPLLRKPYHRREFCAVISEVMDSQETASNHVT